MIRLYAWFYDEYPVIKSITRETMMGNCEDVTYYYYIGFDTTSCTASSYNIEYSFWGHDYSIFCDLEENPDSYEEALEYIQNVKEAKELTFFKVYDEYNCDITDVADRYAGPLSDFYKNNSFHTKPNFFSRSDIYILDNNHNYKKYNENSYIIQPSKRRLSL